MSILRIGLWLACATFAAKMAIAQVPCQPGSFSVQPAVARVGEDLVFEGFDGVGYCSFLELVEVGPGAPEFVLPVPKQVEILLNRFAVEVLWHTADRVGTGELMFSGYDYWLTNQSAGYWFFNRSNLELAVKMVDGCEVNGHRWLFVSGFTDQGYNVLVRELSTGVHVVVTNPLGQLASVHADTAAFPCDP